MRSIALHRAFNNLEEVHQKQITETSDAFKHSLSLLFNGADLAVLSETRKAKTEDLLTLQAQLQVLHELRKIFTGGDNGR